MKLKFLAGFSSVLVLFLVLILAGGATLWWSVRQDPEAQTQDPQGGVSLDVGAAKSPGPNNLTDSEPYEPRCDFWKPWLTLVAPETPKSYLQAIAQLVVDGAARTSQYQDLIMRDPGLLGALRGEGEHLCIAGAFSQNNQYHLDANKASACHKKPARFLDQNLEIKVTPLDEGGFENKIKFAVHLGGVTPGSFRDFWVQQTNLMHKGYRGWSKAFPTYHNINQNGFGLVAITSQAQPFTELRFDWLTQAMMSSQIDWATFLLKLGDLARVDMAVETDQGLPLLSYRIETRLSSVTLKVPRDDQNIFKDAKSTPITIGHDVLVKFRGLEVRIKGLKYKGILQNNAEKFAFDGWFDGVNQVEIAGNYRGLGMTGGLGKMIHDLVKEIIDREIGRLKKGHGGQPASLRLGLYRKESQGQLEFEMDFDAAVNVLNIVREEKDQVDSPVMPNKKTIRDINQWAQKTMGALISDFETTRCQL